MFLVQLGDITKTISLDDRSLTVLLAEVLLNPGTLTGNVRDAKTKACEGLLAFWFLDLVDLRVTLLRKFRIVIVF